MAEGKLETAKATEQRSLVAFGNGRGLQPKDMEGAYRCAQYVAMSGLAPKDMSTAEAILIAAAMGDELGLTFMQSLQSIAVINGRPSVWGDALLALCLGTGQMVEFNESFEGEGDDLTAVCKATRRHPSGFDQPTVERFSVDDARKAKLWGKVGPWQNYPRRMLKMRARGFALRDLFADVLKGIKTTEEVMDYDEPATVQTKGFKPIKGKTQADPAMPEASEVQDAQLVDDETPQIEETQTAETKGRRRLVGWPNTDLKTAGISPQSIQKITDCTLQEPEKSDTIKAFFETALLPDTQHELTFLNEHEAVKLLKILEAKEPQQEEHSATTSGEPLIHCEDGQAKGDDVTMAYCEDACKSHCPNYHKAKARQATQNLFAGNK